MRVKRAGIATKLLVLVLLAVLAAGLLSTQAKLTEARSARDELARQVEEQREANAALADDIAHSGDPEYLADIAGRDRVCRFFEVEARRSGKRLSGGVCQWHTSTARPSRR